MGRKSKRKAPKRPAAKQPVIATKTPRISQPGWQPGKVPVAAPGGVDYGRQKPAWRVAHLETDDPFGWHRIEQSKVLEIHSKLRAFESMTWHEILVTGKKQHHHVPLDQLSRRAIDRLEQLRACEFISDRYEGVPGRPSQGAPT